ncbi:DsbA family oxidoreductase [Mesobacterium pallidum]|uniref:DsbA family oxidoreductase n=1 Tax=Mesobacterium pallidum TaxID=2872037 RepID=UPI001EE26B7F|nr:DsbA family oxidoreductase [Mesobacterium pallidum]
MIKLAIFSDPICPWCYIGKTQLDRALEAAPDHPFDVEWHPFQLNPDMPVGGMDRRAYLAAKFGGEEGALAAYTPIMEHAKSIGLNIEWDRIARTPNTLDAHRLIHWAGIEGCQTPVAAALFRAYFKDGRDIADPEVLADIGDSFGMDGAAILRLLATDADREEIRNRDAAAREMGITGVPCFIVAGQHAVPGAQPAELWAKVIAELNGAAEA